MQKVAMKILLGLISSLGLGVLLISGCTPAPPENDDVTQESEVTVTLQPKVRQTIKEPQFPTGIVSPTETPGQAIDLVNEPSETPFATNTTLKPSPTTKPTSFHFGSSRKDPAPYGSTTSIGIVEFKIADLIRPATEMVMNASTANPKPKEGMEYVLVDLIEVCAAPTHLECFIKVHNMKLIGSTGVERNAQNIVGLPFMLPNRHIKGGTTAYGYVAFLVVQDEEDLVFYYESDSDGTVYLSTE